jgi:hypothetical protein
LIIRNETRDNTEQGGLAAAAWTDDREEFVIADFKVYVAEREHAAAAVMQRAEFFAQAPHFYHRHSPD